LSDDRNLVSKTPLADPARNLQRKLPFFKVRIDSEKAQQECGVLSPWRGCAKAAQVNEKNPPAIAKSRVRDFATFMPIS